MNTANFCLQCNTPLNSDALFCPKCGTKMSAAEHETQAVERAPLESPKSSKVTLVLCMLFGMLGAHRFYVGKKWTGILMLLSCGGLGVWVLIDLILILKNKFEDKKGRPLQLTHDLSPVKETLLVVGSVVAWSAVFIASIAAILMYTTSSLVRVVSYQLTALHDGNIKQAYSLNSKDFQTNLPVEGFKQWIDHFPALKNNESYSFPNRKILNNKGFLGGTLTSEDGVQTSVEYQLINEDGNWRVFNIKIITSTPGVNKIPQ